jgi:hypothetical protein
MPFMAVDAAVDMEYHIAESMAVEEATEQIRKILDAKYQATDLEKVCLARSISPRVSTTTEAVWSTQQVQWLVWWNPEQMETGSHQTPYHAQPFPIPKCHAESLKMEVKQLVEIEVLKKVNQLEWAAPWFIIPKKDGTTQFINNFRELNKQIKWKPFPILTI